MRQARKNPHDGHGMQTVALARLVDQFAHRALFQGFSVNIASA